jgi:hypothetical protein
MNPKSIALTSWIEMPPHWETPAPQACLTFNFKFGVARENSWLLRFANETFLYVAVA